MQINSDFLFSTVAQCSTAFIAVAFTIVAISFSMDQNKLKDHDQKDGDCDHIFRMSYNYLKFKNFIKYDFTKAFLLSVFIPIFLLIINPFFPTSDIWQIILVITEVVAVLLSTVTVLFFFQQSYHILTIGSYELTLFNKVAVIDVKDLENEKKMIKYICSVVNSEYYHRELYKGNLEKEVKNIVGKDENNIGLKEWRDKKEWNLFPKVQSPTHIMMICISRLEKKDKDPIPKINFCIIILESHIRHSKRRRDKRHFRNRFWGKFEESPNDSIVYALYGNLLWSKGDLIDDEGLKNIFYQEALKLYDLALKIDESNLVAKENGKRLMQFIETKDVPSD